MIVTMYMYDNPPKKYLKRLGQHHYDCKKEESYCALGKHAMKFGQSFNFDETSIIDYEVMTKKRLFKEMIYILGEISSCNQKSDADHLNSIYMGILNKCRKLKWL